jgi:hypothetical protein
MPVPCSLSPQITQQGNARVQRNMLRLPPTIRYRLMRSRPEASFLPDFWTREKNMTKLTNGYMRFMTLWGKPFSAAWISRPLHFQGRFLVAYSDSILCASFYETLGTRLANPLNSASLEPRELADECKRPVVQNECLDIRPTMWNTV